MLALYRAGRQADALTAYRDGREALVDGLGLDPSDELQALERAILQHDPALAAPSNGAHRRERAGAEPPPARWIPVVGAAAAAVVAVVVLVTRDAGGGDVAVVANGVGLLEGGKLVAADAVGASPSEVAVTSDSAWVTSTDDQTVSRVDLGTGHVRQAIPWGAARRQWPPTSTASGSPTPSPARSRASTPRRTPLGHDPKGLGRHRSNT